MSREMRISWETALGFGNIHTKKHRRGGLTKIN